MEECNCFQFIPHSGHIDCHLLFTVMLTIRGLIKVVSCGIQDTIFTFSTCIVWHGSLEKSNTLTAILNSILDFWRSSISIFYGFTVESFRILRNLQFPLNKRPYLMSSWILCQWSGIVRLIICCISTNICSFLINVLGRNMYASKIENFGC